MLVHFCFTFIPTELYMNKQNCLKQALSIIGDRRNKEAAEKKAKEKELLKVSIKKEDVDLIVSILHDM